MSSTEKILDRLSRLALREIEGDELEQPVAASYEELAERIREELSHDATLSESKLRIIRSSLAVLIQRRIGKILEKLVSGEDIPGRLLYKEERKLVEIFSRLKIDSIRETKPRETETLERVTEYSEAEAKIEEQAPSTRPFIPGDIGIVQFLEDFPALQSVTLRTFGPFSKFDIAALPADDVEELKRKNIVDVLF